MKFEQPPISENKSEETEEKIISLSRDEFKRLSGINTEDPEDIKFMQEKGVSFDSGDIFIEIDGSRQMMTTKKVDFGTLLLPETIEKLYGKEKSIGIGPLDSELPKKE
ncbi:hypothetical protein KKA27_00310 [Patescibacteria group bacterium]|nr:hypothetical protein [Patescibacteria group bacterium]MBU2633365.1 hypothetical protein [Patescibacteria group bacterium]